MPARNDSTVRLSNASPKKPLTSSRTNHWYRRDAGGLDVCALTGDIMVRGALMTGTEANAGGDDLEAFRNAVGAGDVPAVRRLLASTAVRDQINAPMFVFGQRAIHIAAKRPALLEELIAAGA